MFGHRDILAFHEEVPVEAEDGFIVIVARQFFILVRVADRMRNVVPRDRHGGGMRSTCPG